MNTAPITPAEKRRIKNRAYFQANKERLRTYSKEYQRQHRAQLNEARKGAYDENRKMAKKSYYERNRELILSQKREYYLRQIDSIQSYRTENRHRISEQNSMWHRENRDRIRNRKKEESRRRNLNPSNRLAGNLRRRLTKLIRCEGRKPGCQELLGCSFRDFADRLSGMFRPGMGWHNYGAEWHVDHIIPCSVFDLSKEAQVRQCFHFTNLQPLWVRDNLRKGTKISDPQLFLPL